MGALTIIDWFWRCYGLVRIHISDNTHMERGSSGVECRTRNRVISGSNPALLPFRRLGIFVLSIVVPVDSAVNEYLAIDSGGHVSDLVLARNCCLARMLPGEAELVS